MPSPALGRVVGPWPLPSSCQHRAGQAGGRGTGLAAGTGGSQGSGCRGCAEFGAGGWGSREDEGLLSVFWLFGGGQCRDVHGARGRMQGAGASTGCAPCLRGGMQSAAPPRDARHSTHRGCTEQLPRGMHRTAPTRAARHCNHAGGTARHPRGMHTADPGQAAQHGTHTGGTARHPHGTHTAPTAQHRGAMRGAGCGMPVVAPGAGVGSAGSSGHTKRRELPRSHAEQQQHSVPGGGGHRHMMGSDVGAPRVSHATACCHPHGHCGQTPGTLGTAGCC